MTTSAFAWSLFQPPPTRSDLPNPTVNFMNDTKPESIADKEARLWNPGVLFDYAYLYKVDAGPIVPRPRKGRHKTTPKMLQTFNDLVEEAKGKKLSGRPRDKVLGDLGEYFAAIMFGIRLHDDPKAQGSDGKIGNELVEVKTITPGKTRDVVRLRSTRNFSMVAVVKITDDFQFGARLIKRKSLKKAVDEWIELAWDDMVAGAGEYTLEVNRNFPITVQQ